VSFLLPERYSSRFSAGTRDQSCGEDCVSMFSSQVPQSQRRLPSSHQFPIISPSSNVFISCLAERPSQNPHTSNSHTAETYLIKVDNRLPEVVALLVEIPHSDLSKVTGMVLVHVCSVVMLSTSQTTTTGMLAMLSYTTVTGRDVTAAVFLTLA